MLATFGQSNVQSFGCGDRIIKEHLVKIAHPVKQNGAGILRLDFQILRHHRRYGFVGQPASPFARPTLQNGIHGEKRQVQRWQRQFAAL